MYLLIIIYGYVLVAGLLIFFILRDRRKHNLFFGQHRQLAIFCAAFLIIGIIIAFYSTLIEPIFLKTNRVEITIKSFKSQLRIVFVSDIQIGPYKKEPWAKKIADRINSVNPDLVIFGGDQIDNEATFEDESRYLEPLRGLSLKYPVYYVVGNHESGIGGKVRFFPSYFTGDRTQLLIDRFDSFGFKLLRNSLDCPTIKNQKICLFGIDDIWKKTPDFEELENRQASIPLIFISHNPDGILYYPEEATPPDLVLAGHTHGGQVWLPFYGPLASAQTTLGPEFYRGLNYFGNIPMFTSVGAGESGAPLRLFVRPEIAVIKILP